MLKTVCLGRLELSSSAHFGTGQTHLNSDAKIADEGRPQGAPLPIVFSRRYALGRAPTRGAPTNCLLSALCLGEGTHKGRPYQLPSLGVMPWGGHPQGAPLPIVFSRRYALGRAPTRGAPANCLLSALCPGEGTHKGRPYQLPSLGVMPWGGHPQGAPLPDSGSLTWVCPNLMQLPCILGCTRLRWAGRGHSSEVQEAVARVTVGGCKMAQTFLSVYQ